MENDTKKQMTSGVIISYLVIIVQFLTGLIYTPIMLQTLGQSEYGIYSLCTSFMGYFTILNGGVNAAYIRFFVQMKETNPHKTSGVNGIFLKIFSLLSLITLIAGFIVAIFSPQIFGNKISTYEYSTVKECFRFLAISSALQVLNCVFSSLVIAHERFIFGKTVNLIGAIMNPVLTVPFLLNGYGCVIIIIVHLFTTLAMLLVNVFFCLYTLHVKFDLKEKDALLLRDIAQFAGFIVLQNIMDQVNWQIDKFILARTHGTDEISLYSVGSTFNKYFITFSGALSGVFIARINKLQANKDKNSINLLFLKSSRIFAYLIWLFMSAYLIFGHPFVLRWAGIEYDKSFLIGGLLMLPVTVSLTMGLGQDIARAMNKHQIQILINFGICVINLIISIPLAMKWGAIGSALGTFLSEICICVIAEPIYYKKVLGLEIGKLIRELGRILPGLILPVIYGIIISWFNLLKPNYYVIVPFGICYVIIYALSMYIFAMNKEEKNIVRRFLNKIIFRKYN